MLINYPNIYTLLELYALIPVSVAGAERSFSTLKLIKTYLRNRIGDKAGTGWKMVNRSGPAGNRPVGITWSTGEIPVKQVKKWRTLLKNNF